MFNIDWNAVVAIVGVLQLIGGLIVGALFWRLRSEFVSRKELSALRGNVDEHHTRLTRIETETRSLPTSRDLHTLANSMERLSGELAVAVERVGGIKEDLDRIERTLTRHEDILSNAARGGR